tara:strand:- start:19 stop:327 length:309 start_codon:yes stop_codon:yes gene_type:complete
MRVEALKIDFKDLCVHCFEDTSFGSGKFVNRVPADSTIDANAGLRYIRVDGYSCAECLLYGCDRCSEKIGMDEDFYLEEIDERVCENCLTFAERIRLESEDE